MIFQQEHVALKGGISLLACPDPCTTFCPLISQSSNRSDSCLCVRFWSHQVELLPSSQFKKKKLHQMFLSQFKQYSVQKALGGQLSNLS